MRNQIKIEAGKLGWLLFIGGVKVNFSDCEFCTLKDLRKYWNKHRNMLILGFRHTNLTDYLYN